MKRVIVVGFLLSMFLAPRIVECYATENSGETVTFSVLYNQRVATPFRKDWLILEEYAHRRNVILDVRLGNDSDYGAAVTRTLESGSMPDIILKVWPQEVERFAASGILLAFSDYERLMPHFTAYIEKHDLRGELDKLRLENGKYYVLPGYQRRTQVQQWVYRRDIYTANGLDAPETYDDLLSSLTLLKGIYPNATPLTACWGGAHLLAMMGAGYGISAGWAGTRHYDPEMDRWLFSPATENYRELYRFLNRCYRAGVLDPAVFTQSDAAFYAKLQNGEAFMTVTWITSGFRTWNEKLRENGFPGGEWAALPVPESTIGTRALPPVDPFRKGLVVSSRVVDEPYFEDLLRFLDWAVYSEEGMTLTTWGVEGVTFENTPDGKAFLPQIRTTRNPDGVLDMTAEYGLATLFDLNEDTEFEDYKKPSDIVQFLERSLQANETAEMSPALRLSANAVDAIGAISGAIETYVAAASLDFITGRLNIDTDWDGYILALEQKGYLTLEAIWNAAWEEQNG